MYGTVHGETFKPQDKLHEFKHRLQFYEPDCLVKEITVTCNVCVIR
jgi:hypothetical protein